MNQALKAIFDRQAKRLNNNVLAGNIFERLKELDVNKYNPRLY